jgi:hypothetical protein
MKCIYCSSDARYKDRQANRGRCGACGHPFAFEPKTDPLTVTDTRFQRAIQDVSGDGAVFFTERQLYYEFNRRVARRPIWRAPWGWVAAGSVAAGIVATGVTGLPWIFAGFAGVAVSGIISRHAGRKTPLPVRISHDTFREKYLGRWTLVHGAIEKLLPAVEAPRRTGAQSSEPKAQGSEPPDLTAYSFDRALVTNLGETAAMLVANNFHFENNCAILSADGYPYERAETILAMLRQNPQLTVFAVHDASIPGCHLPRRLREERWFPDPALRIVDLGLRPAHAQQMRLPVLEGTPEILPAELQPGLTAAEAAWLAAGKRVELAALRPAKLMRSIYQGFARADLSGTADDGSPGFIVWGNDPGTGVYASDSFG